MEFTKGLLTYVLIMLLTAGCTVLLMRGCSKTTSLQQSKTAVDSVAQRHGDSIKWALSENDRLRGDSITQADVIDNQARQLAWYEAQLSSTGQEIGETMGRMDTARIRHDTIPFIVNCDTLEDQVKQARVQIHGFRLATDSLIDSYQTQLRIDDSMKRNFRSAFLHADSAGNFYKDQYNALYKRQKRSILTEKVLVGAGAALILGLLIKK